MYLDLTYRLPPKHVTECLDRIALFHAKLAGAKRQQKANSRETESPALLAQTRRYLRASATALNWLIAHCR
jgi:hypothetical protein